MLESLRTTLGPIRKRQRAARAIRWTICGLMIGALLGSLCVLASWIGVPTSPMHVWLVCGASLLLSLIGSQIWPLSWNSSAELVDTAYQLKDRTLTALDFASRSRQETVHRLQIEDALDRLSQVDARRVVHWSLPRWAPAAMTALVVMVALVLFAWPPARSIANVPPGPLKVVVEQAERLEETMLKDLRELAEATDDPELEQLAEAMEQAVEELKDPNVDQREALAQLSEMQAVLAAALQELGIEQVDAQLQQLSESLQIAEATAAASSALRESNYERAADELEKIDTSTMTRKQRDAVAANLAKLASKLGQGKRGQLGEAVEDLVDGLENEDRSKSKSGFSKIAGVCRKQSLKKQISECLGCQLNRLTACKGLCQGDGMSPGNKVARSENPSNKAGTGVSNQPLGEEATKLDSRRREEELTGISGEGPSERETLTATEARQDAARAYRQRYAEFRKRMEEVLDSEPLPLGHRQMVRKYFETIRPSNREHELIDALE